MKSGRFAGTWLFAVGVGSIIATVVRGSFDSLAFPLLLGAAGLMLLLRTRQAPSAFPGTDLERGLDRLFALLLPGRAPTATRARGTALAQQVSLVKLRLGARRWRNALQLITTDGYDTAARISARHASAGELDDAALVAEAVRVLAAERAAAGVDPDRADTVALLAYGLGAWPATADLRSLEDLLFDLGLPGEGDELHAHFDEVIAVERLSKDLHLRSEAQRSLFRNLAGASFVLGAAARIVELASLVPTLEAAATAGLGTSHA